MEISIKVEGMSCEHCVRRVKKAIEGIPGVISSEVGIGTAKVSFDEAKVKKEEIIAAVEKAGYKVIQ
ncbi:MAG: heavy-metal-associated domain-containing protein [Thermodesulfovibrionales bacterium]|jgi:copper ion binding protein